MNFNFIQPTMDFDLETKLGAKSFDIFTKENVEGARIFNVEETNFIEFQERFKVAKDLIIHETLKETATVPTGVISTSTEDVVLMTDSNYRNNENGHYLMRYLPDGSFHTSKLELPLAYTSLSYIDELECVIGCKVSGSVFLAREGDLLESFKSTALRTCARKPAFSVNGTSIAYKTSRNSVIIIPEISFCELASQTYFEVYLEKISNIIHIETILSKDALVFGYNGVMGIVSSNGCIINEIDLGINELGLTIIAAEVSGDSNFIVINCYNHTTKGEHLLIYELDHSFQAKLLDNLSLATGTEFCDTIVSSTFKCLYLGRNVLVTLQRLKDRLGNYNESVATYYALDDASKLKEIESIRLESISGVNIQGNGELIAYVPFNGNKLQKLSICND